MFQAFLSFREDSSDIDDELYDMITQDEVSESMHEHVPDPK